MPTLHVVMPIYNERATLDACVQRVVDAPLPPGWSHAVVMVDDHSHADALRHTQEVAAALVAAGCRAVLLRHAENRGKGAALQTGFDHLLAASAAEDDLVIIQDADLEYDPRDYLKLMRPLLDGEADAVLGTRWGDHRPAAGLKRRIHAWGNALLTALSNGMTGFRVSDMECCYKLMPVSWLRRLRPMLTEERYGIEPQIVAGLSRLRARVVEVPVAYDPRGIAEGKKIGPRDAARAVWVILRERFRGRSPRRP